MMKLPNLEACILDIGIAQVRNLINRHQDDLVALTRFLAVQHVFEHSSEHFADRKMSQSHLEIRRMPFPDQSMTQYRVSQSMICQRQIDPLETHWKQWTGLSRNLDSAFDCAQRNIANQTLNLAKGNGDNSVEQAYSKPKQNNQSNSKKQQEAFTDTSHSWLQIFSKLIGNCIKNETSPGTDLSKIAKLHFLLVVDNVYNKSNTCFGKINSKISTMNLTESFNYSMYYQEHKLHESSSSALFWGEQKLGLRNCGICDQEWSEIEDAALIHAWYYASCALDDAEEFLNEYNKVHGDRAHQKLLCSYYHENIENAAGALLSERTPAELLSRYNLLSELQYVDVDILYRFDKEYGEKLKANEFNPFCLLDLSSFLDCVIYAQQSANSMLLDSLEELIQLRKYFLIKDEICTNIFKIGASIA